MREPIIPETLFRPGFFVLIVLGIGVIHAVGAVLLGPRDTWFLGMWLLRLSAWVLTVGVVINACRWGILTTLQRVLLGVSAAIGVGACCVVTFTLRMN